MDKDTLFRKIEEAIKYASQLGAFAAFDYKEGHKLAEMRREIKVELDTLYSTDIAEDRND